jgi:hypothetical protein
MSDDRLTALLRSKAALEAQVESLQNELLARETDRELEELRQEVRLLDHTNKENTTTIALMQSILEEKNEAIELLQAKHDLDLDGQGSNFQKVLRLKDEAYEVLEHRLDQSESEREALVASVAQYQVNIRKMQEQHEEALKKHMGTSKASSDKEVSALHKRAHDLEIAVGQEQQKAVAARESLNAEVRRIKREEQIRLEHEKSQFDHQVQVLQGKLLDLERIVSSHDTAMGLCKEEAQRVVSEREQELLKTRRELQTVIEQVRTSQHAVTRANEIMEKERSQRAAITMTHTQLVSEVDTLRAELSETLRLSSDQSHELAAHLGIIAQLKGDMEALERACDAYAIERDEANRAASASRSDVSKAMAEARAKDDEVRIVRSELSASVQLSQELQRTYDLMATTTKRREDSVRQREEEVRRLQERLAESNEAMMRHESEAQRYHNDLERAEENIRRLEETLVKAKRTHQDELERTQDKERAAKEQIQAERQRVRELELAATDDVERANMRRENSRLADQITNLTAMLRDKDADKDRTAQNNERLELLERYMTTVKTKLLEVCINELSGGARIDRTELARHSVVDLASEVAHRAGEQHTQVVAYAQFAADIRRERHSLCQHLLDESLLGPVDLSQGGGEDEPEEQRRWMVAKLRIPQILHLIRNRAIMSPVSVVGDPSGAYRDQYDQIVTAVATLKRSVQTLRTARSMGGGLVQPQLDEVFQASIEAMRLMQTLAERVHNDLGGPAGDTLETSSNLSSASKVSRNSVRSAAAPTLSRTGK